MYVNHVPAVPEMARRGHLIHRVGAANLTLVLWESSDALYCLAISPVPSYSVLTKTKLCFKEKKTGGGAHTYFIILHPKCLVAEIATHSLLK